MSMCGLMLPGVPERENRLEFRTQESDLTPQAADVDAADRPVVVHQLQWCQERDASGLGCEMGRVAPLPVGQVGESERD